MPIPAQYDWLTREQAIPMLYQGLKYNGTLETAGPKSNPLIMHWSKITGMDPYYSDDSVPWCGLFMAACAKEAMFPFPKIAVRASAWAEFGYEAKTAKLGDVIVFQRPGGGHVGFYIGEDDECFHIFGGNQSDKVGFTRIEKSRMIAIRRPPYRVEPKNLRQIRLKPSGVISKNEG